MMQSYVLMSIGPVQSYISQAKRTQDLWFGSRLLSLLAREALRHIPNYEQSIVYPYIAEWDTPTLSIPNRLMFRCDTHQAKNIAEKIKKEVEGKWLDVAHKTRQHLQSKAYGQPIVSDEIWHRQIINWVEIHYVIVPALDDYKASNKSANEMMATRKLVRDFRQTYEPGFKCSITGEHEALHNPNQESYRDVQRFWKNIQRRQRNLSLIGDGEQLCSLSVIKRIAHEANPDLAPDTRFPSTSSIASARFRAGIIENWKQPDLIARVHAYLHMLETLFEHFGRDKRDLYFYRQGVLNPEHYPFIEQIIERNGISKDKDDQLLTRFMSLDGDFFYDDVFQQRTIATYMRLEQVNDIEKKMGILEDVRNALSDLLKATKNAGIPKPSSYLAILSMDGDRVGSHVETFDEATQHTTFSINLVGFAQNEIRQDVEEQVPGRVVYAGGDDVLALLPCTDVLTTADNIRKQFQVIFPSLTISAGIAIVHRTYPLQGAVNAAKKAQDYAKETLNGDAFAVEFLKRSGELQLGGMNWVENYSVIPVIMDVVERMIAQPKEKISLHLPYEMENLNYALVGHLTADQARNAGVMIPDEARAEEFKRIFKRRCGKTFKETEDAKKLLKQLTDIAQNAGSYGQGWHDLQFLLRLARFLAQEGNANVADD
jgi:CRISPR-associated protein Cmr2